MIALNWLGASTNCFRVLFASWRTAIKSPILNPKLIAKLAPSLYYPGGRIDSSGRREREVVALRRRNMFSAVRTTRLALPPVRLNLDTCISHIGLEGLRLAIYLRLEWTYEQKLSSVRRNLQTKSHLESFVCRERLNKVIPGMVGSYLPHTNHLTDVEGAVTCKGQELCHRGNTKMCNIVRTEHKGRAAESYCLFYF